MFGKTKETSDVDERAGLDITIDDFFGDENAVAEAVRVDHLHQRVTQVEQQISSQFTSLAAYAQIAQEQVELVRSEAQHGNERSEQRVVSLIERERADRIASPSGGGTDVSVRLDSLDAQVAEIRDGLQQCLSNQKALADAITELFTPGAVETAPPAPTARALADSVPSPSAPVMTAPMVTTAMPAPLVAAPAPATQDPTIPPPPPIDPFSYHDLDRELEKLGIDMCSELDSNELEANELATAEFAVPDLVEIEPIEAQNDRITGTIDGLSLA